MNPAHGRNLLLIGVGCVLMLSTLIAGTAHLWWRRPAHESTLPNLNARIKCWWAIAAVLALAFLCGNIGVFALFALLSVASLREFLTASRPGPADRPALVAAFFLFLPAQFYFAWKGWHGLMASFIPICGILCLPLLATLNGDASNFLGRIGQIQCAVLICVYSVSYVPALLTLHLRGAGAQVSNSGALAVFLIVTAECSDVMQYVFGKLLGRRRIAPRLSPSKTIEGLTGGVTSAAALGGLLWWITPFQRWQAAAMALMIALLGFLGGLVMSAIKRDRGLKDWGRLLPGHGGVLDRMDSICFAAPAFFHLTRYCFSSSS